MSDLTQFLNTRIGEEEVMLRLALDAFGVPGSAGLYRDHFSPERLLREVEAKRAIVRRCAVRMNELDAYPNGLVSPRAMLARQTLIDLADVYSDHHDYREAWTW